MTGILPVMSYEKYHVHTGTAEFAAYRPGATDVRSGSSVQIARFSRVDEEQALAATSLDHGLMFM
jgi:hypothetical protein